MPAVALTDSANLFGGLEFAQGCSGKGIQPIMGCQLFLSRTASDDRPEAERQPPDPIVALAMDARGLDNLRRLSSRGFLANDASGRPCLKLSTTRGACGRAVPPHRWHLRADRAPFGGRPPCPGRGLAAPPGRRLPGPDRGRAAPPRPRGRAGDRAAECWPWPTNSACRSSPPTTSISPRRECMRRMTRCSASPRGGRWPRKIAAASPPSTGSSRPRRCGRCSPTCRRPATTRWP